MDSTSRDVLHDLLDGGELELSESDKAFARSYPQDVVYVSMPAPVTPLPASSSARQAYEAIHNEATRGLGASHPFRDYAWMWEQCNIFRETVGTYYPLEADRLVAGFSSGIPTEALIADCAILLEKLNRHLGGKAPEDLVPTAEPLSNRVLHLCLATNHINMAHLREHVGDLALAVEHAYEAARNNEAANGPLSLRADYHYMQAAILIQLARLKNEDAEVSEEMKRAKASYRIACILDPEGTRLSLRRSEYPDLELLESKP